MIIRTAASSANLGPGFDCLGLAWQLYNEIDFELAGEGLRISGCEERFQNSGNLAFRGFQAALSAAGAPMPEGLYIAFRSAEIPVSRGLGSSAALTAAGVLAADRLCCLGLTAQQLLDAATAVEGHPDNVAPVLLGGLTASLMAGERAVSRRLPLSDSLFFSGLVPPFELSTAASRGVLPESLPYRDAVFSASRATLLPRALADGDPELLALCMEDRLHQPYRFPLIRGAEEAIGASKAAGAAAVCLSGAGSTLLAVSGSRESAQAVCAAVSALLPGWRCIPLEPDKLGAVAALEKSDRI